VKTEWADCPALLVEVTWECFHCRKKEKVSQEFIGFSFHTPLSPLQIMPSMWGCFPNCGGANVGAICYECMKWKTERRDINKPKEDPNA
jgi:hypothetical protein